jgi:hypothetical protein
MSVEGNEALELKGMYQLLIYADVNLCDDTHTAKKNTEALFR